MVYVILYVAVVDERMVLQQMTYLGWTPTLEITQRESHQRASIQHIAKLLRRCDLWR